MASESSHNFSSTWARAYAHEDALAGRSNYCVVRGIRYDKRGTDIDGFIDNLRDHPMMVRFMAGDLEGVRKSANLFMESEGNFNCRDRITNETLLHVMCESEHLYTKYLFTCYMLAVKVDLDTVDCHGDTVLHKVCRRQGGWRCIVAFMRCGAFPMIKNRAGRSPEEEILYYKNPGWEENLYWFRKFYPGLWVAGTADEPDPVLIKRLLSYWCRAVKFTGEGEMRLKDVLQKKGRLDLVSVVEEYENTNELVLALLSNDHKSHYRWTAAETQHKINVDTKDHSYVYYWKNYPTAPRPLLASLWSFIETDTLKFYLDLKPDTAVKYTFEAESKPKPLFFQFLDVGGQKFTSMVCYALQLFNPKCRPASLEVISMVLQASDLNLRNYSGQTVLVEAMYAGQTEDIIETILKAGVDVGARDGLGLTARDHAKRLKNKNLVHMIDNHVLRLINPEQEQTRLQALILQMYDFDHFARKAGKIKNILKARPDVKGSQIREAVAAAANLQATVLEMFALAKAGNKAQLMSLLEPRLRNARNKAGCGLLHAAVQHGATKARPYSKTDARMNRDLLREDGDSSLSYNVDCTAQRVSTPVHRGQESKADWNFYAEHIWNTPNTCVDTGSSNVSIVHQAQWNEDNIKNIEEMQNTTYMGSKDNPKSYIEAPSKQFRRDAAIVEEKFPKVYIKEHLPETDTYVDHEPDYVGVMEYLLSVSPEMVHFTNNLGQTPLHYAYIFDVDKEIIDLLRKAGSSIHVKDVFDLEPKDYSRLLKGSETHDIRSQATKELDLRIFLHETNMAENFNAAIQTGDLETVQRLAEPLLELGGEPMFRSCLFDCLDLGHFDIACYLVQAGFSTYISKQYQVCDPDNTMCAMMECNHPVTSLCQRAIEVGAMNLASLINKTKL